MEGWGERSQTIVRTQVAPIHVFPVEWSEQGEGVF